MNIEKIAIGLLPGALPGINPWQIVTADL